MEEVSGSPFLHTLGSEDAALYCYFLGKNVPKGARTVVATVTGAAVKSAVSISLLGPKNSDLRIFNNAAVTNESASAKEAGVGPFEELGAEPLALAAFHLGSAEVSELTPLAGRTELLATHDFGVAVAAYTAGVKPNDGVGVAQITQASADEFGAIAVQVAPVRNWGLVTALPTRAGKGDICSYVADKTKGIIWELIYDGEGEYPWKKIGGHALSEFVAAQQETESTTYTNLATTGPTITAPLKGDYRVTMEARIQCAAGFFSAVDVSYNAGAPADTDSTKMFVFSETAKVESSVSRTIELSVPEAGKTIQMKYKVNTKSKGFFAARRLLVDPVRVG
jgi:hypothetical protein